MNIRIYGVLSVFTLISFFSCKSDQKQMVMPPPTIPTVEVVNKDVVSYRTFPVSIEGKVNNAVRAKISGYIAQVFVDEGQMVTKGQPLFRLETNVQSQDANAARSGVSAAQANIEAAKASVSAAQVEVDKLTPLVERNIVSNVQLETAKANLMRAQGQLEQAKAARKQASSSYSAVAANVNYGIVRSPITGVVGAINFREGSLVGPGDQMPITTVSETSEVYAYFSMNESQYFDFLEQTPGKDVSEKLKNMPEVDLFLPNGRQYAAKGKIKTVTGQINPQTGTIQFRATFPNKEQILSNGNSGKVQIPVMHKGVLVVPESAAFEQQGATYVYRVGKDTVTNIPIKVIARVHNMVLVESGLKTGDIVVAQDTGKLKPGAAIKPVPTSMDSIVNAIKPIF